MDILENRVKIVQNQAPANEPVTESEVAGQLKLDSDQQSADSGLIARLIATARQWFEHNTNRQLITATYTQYFQQFIEPMILWNPPLQSVTEIKYKDDDGNTQTFSSTKYVVDDKMDPGGIWRANDETWPSNILNEVNPIWIKYKAGYGDKASDVPMDVKSIILWKIAKLYENRVPTKEDSIGSEDNLLRPYMVRAL